MFNTRNCLKTTTTTTNMMEEEATAAAAASTMEETIVLSMIPLGKDKRLEVRSDGVYIHSVSKPEKNIFMSYNNWSQLKSVLQDVDQEARELNKKSRPVKYRIHIGSGIHISVNTGYLCVDFRLFFLPYGMQKIRPSRKGVALRLDEWSELLDLIPFVEASNPELALAAPCYTHNDHMNQLGMLSCTDCNPFRSTAWN